MPAVALPAYDDFPPGRSITGTVTTRFDRTLTGRLVFDLDENETTDTLDAPSEGVDYIIPFGLIAKISIPAGERGDRRVRVTLHSGEALALERGGDLGDTNLGMLITADDGEPIEYVSWEDVARIDLDRPAAMYPPEGTR